MVKQSDGRDVGEDRERRGGKLQKSKTRHNSSKSSTERLCDLQESGKPGEYKQMDLLCYAGQKWFTFASI